MLDSCLVAVPFQANRMKSYFDPQDRPMDPPSDRGHSLDFRLQNQRSHILKILLHRKKLRTIPLLQNGKFDLKGEKCHAMKAPITPLDRVNHINSLILACCLFPSFLHLCCCLLLAYCLNYEFRLLN